MDSFLCPIQQPSIEPWEYYAQERKGFFVKYEIICSLGVPRVIWIAGPWKMAADGTISHFSGLKDLLIPHERLLGDKAYKGDLQSFICPATGEKWALPQEDQTRNYMIYSARQSVERLIHRLKIFNFFHLPWHGTFAQHCQCVCVIAKLVNLSLCFEPLG